MPELGWDEVTIRLALAAVLGGAIGLERELREREAGLRTHLLVSVGAAVFTLVSAYGFADFRYGLETGITLDPTRIAAQIVTGIGFLGAGAIIRQGLSVRGLTTAATLWVVAAIGMATGAGYYSVAVIGTGLVLFSLYPLRQLAYRAVVRLRPEEGRLVVTLSGGSSAAPVVEELERAGVRIDSLQLDESGDERVVVAEIRTPQARLGAELVDRLHDLEHVRRVEWIA
ncbi:MAG: MgtC/SapB family protein [Thermoleophilia bacterium]|nr:MgtC/SapB family protein [Thermoleophilia bacterium]